MRRSPTNDCRIPSALFLLLGATVLLAGCAAGQPDSITEEGDSVRSLYKWVFGLAVLIFLAVEGAILFMAVKFRRRKNDDGSLPPQIHGDNRLEAVWTITPLAIVLVLFVLAYQNINDLQAEVPADEIQALVDQDKALRVDVTGLQWVWQFAYPDFAWQNSEGDMSPVKILGENTNTIPETAGSVPTLRVPLGIPVQFKLHALDVIHSFYIPQTLYKLDAVPGRVNHFEMTFTETGIYNGQCAELCGTSHADMRFRVEVMPADDFFAWAASEQAKGETSALADIAAEEAEEAAEAEAANDDGTGTSADDSSEENTESATEETSGTETETNPASPGEATSNATDTGSGVEQADQVLSERE